jgi:hypothetical protein
MTSQCTDPFSFVIPAKLVPGLNREPESRSFLGVPLPGFTEQLQKMKNNGLTPAQPAGFARATEAHKTFMLGCWNVYPVKQRAAFLRSRVLPGLECWN